MKTTKEQRGELRLLTDPIREGQWVRGRDDSSIVDARTGETIFEAGPQSSDDPADPRGWIAHLVDAILAVRNTAPDLLDDLDEMQRERDEWKRSAETVATERDHAIRRLQDASDIGKRHAMAEANESANLRVASVIRELRDEIAALERRDAALTEQSNELADSLRSLGVRWKAADGSIRATSEMWADLHAALDAERAKQTPEAWTVDPGPDLLDATPATLRSDRFEVEVHPRAGHNGGQSEMARRLAAALTSDRALRLELAAQQSESRALRAQQHVAAGRVRVPLDIPAFPEWDAEIARGNYAASLVDVLPEHQIPQPERDAPARVLSALTRR